MDNNVEVVTGLVRGKWQKVAIYISQMAESEIFDKHGKRVICICLFGVVVVFLMPKWQTIVPKSYYE